MSTFTSTLFPSSLFSSKSKSDESTDSGQKQSLSSKSHPSKSLEFLFEDDAVIKGAPFGTRLCYGTGTSYLVGLGSGGLFGIYRGLLDVRGITPRLKLNCVLNSSANYGPMIGNSFGLIALFYNLIHGATIYARNGKEDRISSLFSGFASGFIFKLGAGFRNASITGSAVGLSVLGLSSLYNLHANS